MITVLIRKLQTTELYLDGIVSGEVKKRVLQHTAVAGGENKAVAVEPVGILGVVPHHLIVQYVPHRSASHRQTGVAGIRLLHGVDGQETDSVDGLLHELGISCLLQGLHGGGSDHRVADHGGGGAAAGEGGGSGGGGGFESREGGDGGRRGVELVGGAMAGDGGAREDGLRESEGGRGSHGSAYFVFVEMNERELERIKGEI